MLNTGQQAVALAGVESPDRKLRENIEEEQTHLPTSS
jgi:hypothetical protein